ncbi:hypothetical protein Psuf_093520 [Phytohabitans suffuscus]|uniref:STAS domain-containing protein n=1 Tax=Phytohabitans suffuscus TaxID=624315 RepID=A0A6F8Z186_9ACTN|nr:STAS domain-containing protein [Phytohabitans suffuscus]BCB92039.1 hypothetical protein Psuf_093520 [Phytohabitans suffuscus]
MTPGLPRGAPAGVREEPVNAIPEIRTDADVRLVLSGEIDVATVGQVRDAVIALLVREKPPAIVLDFENVSFIDSTGIGELVRCHRAAAVSGSTLTVENLAPSRAGSCGRPACSASSASPTRALTQRCELPRRPRGPPSAVPQAQPRALIRRGGPRTRGGVTRCGRSEAGRTGAPGSGASRAYVRRRGDERRGRLRRRGRPTMPAPARGRVCDTSAEAAGRGAGRRGRAPVTRAGP